MTETILTFEQALAVVLAHAREASGPHGLNTRDTETPALLDAVGQVLAQAVVADRDQPPFDRATRDGYALRAADIGQPLRIVGQLRAGEAWSGAELGEGDAIEIMTGAPLPAGADAVVMIEHVAVDGGALTVESGRRLRSGENVVPRGKEARAGDTVLPVGRVMGAAEIAVAASGGRTQVEVFTRPIVPIIATGDELVELDAPMEAWQIRNSNSYALAALVRAEGGTPARLPIARDSFAELKARMERGMAGDLLVLSGGVSMGKYDLVEEVLAELGAEFLFTGALIQPGKPVVFGRLPTFEPAKPWVYFFGLPGNPVSTQVCFHLFVAPMLRALAGRTEIAPRFVEARLAEDVKGGSKVTRFLPAELSGGWEGVSVRVVGWQGSGDVAANARGNAYAVLPADVAAFSAGETVRVLLR
jgi:molybdopterin molybdotransferase